MDALAKILDTKLRHWKPENSARMRRRVAEVIAVADYEVLDVMRSRRPVPRPPRQWESGQYVVCRLRMGCHCRGGPTEVGLERGSQTGVVRETGIIERLREASLCSLVHLQMLAVS